LTIVMLAILLPLALGLIAIIVSQIVAAKEMGYSVVALYAADTGIEYCIREWRNETNPMAVPPTPLDGASYSVNVEPGILKGGLGPCSLYPNISWCVKAIGDYQGVHRSIEVKF